MPKNPPKLFTIFKCISCLLLFLMTGMTTAVAPQTELSNATDLLREEFPQYVKLFGANPFSFKEWGEFEPAPIGFDMQLMERIVAIASSWARKEGYLPCSMRMGARVLVGIDKPDYVSVYISPLISPLVADHNDRHPEAHIILSRSDLSIVGEIIFHGPCHPK
jgi:hypothetical protein